MLSDIVLFGTPIIVVFQDYNTTYLQNRFKIIFLFNMNITGPERH